MFDSGLQIKYMYIHLYKWHRGILSRAKLGHVSDRWKKWGCALRRRRVWRTRPHVSGMAALERGADFGSKEILTSVDMPPPQRSLPWLPCLNSPITLHIFLFLCSLSHFWVTHFSVSCDLASSPYSGNCSSDNTFFFSFHWLLWLKSSHSSWILLFRCFIKLYL